MNMLLNCQTYDEKCSDVDSESDNFSVDSLEDGRSKERNGTPETEQFVEANVSKVDIILPNASNFDYEKTKFERKSVGKAFQHRRTQSASRPRNQKEYNQTSAKESLQLKSQLSNSTVRRSISSDSASLQACTSNHSPTRKTFKKLTQNIKTNKRSVSYLAQYRVKNPLCQSQQSEDISMNESPSQVSVITNQDDESQLYSDIINGRINGCFQPEYNDNDDSAHDLTLDLTNVSAEDLKSVSEVQFDRNRSSRSLNYIPYTAKDRLLVLPTKLGSLGPDPSSYKEKAESCKKRQQYGIFVSLKNMEMIRHRNLKKKLSEPRSEEHDDVDSRSQYDTRTDELQWDRNSNPCSSTSTCSQVDVNHECATPLSDERLKKQSKFGYGKFKKKQQPNKNVHQTCESENINVAKPESNLDLINKLLRDRHKNELIINTI